MYRYSGQLPANGHLYTEPLSFEMNYLKLLRVDFHVWKVAGKRKNRTSALLSWLCFIYVIKTYVR